MPERTTQNTSRAGVHAVGRMFEQDFAWLFREQHESDFGIDAQVETTTRKANQAGSSLLFRSNPERRSSGAQVSIASTTVSGSTSIIGRSIAFPYTWSCTTPSTRQLSGRRWNRASSRKPPLDGR